MPFKDDEKALVERIHELEKALADAESDLKAGAEKIELALQIILNAKQLED